MIQSPEGDLSPFNFDEVLRQVPELNQLDCDIETIQAWEPLDSSDINHNHWIKLADILNENRDERIDQIYDSAREKELLDWINSIEHFVHSVCVHHYQSIRTCILI